MSGNRRRQPAAQKEPTQYCANGSYHHDCQESLSNARVEGRGSDAQYVRNGKEDACS